MKKNCYNVIFTTGVEVTVYCNGIEEAKILAQSEQIRIGNSYEVSEVIRVS